MRILVTGAKGQVATKLAQKTGGEIEIVAFGRPELDILIPETIDAALQRAKPDLVVNAAAFTAVDLAETRSEDAFSVNRDGARNVARATARMNLPVIQISTDYVFSGRKAEAYVENDRPEPLGVYGMSKLAGENAVLAENPASLILRTSWVYSEIGSNFLKTMLRLGSERDEIKVVSDQFGNPTSAEDIAQAIIRCAQGILQKSGFSAFGIYHFCGTGRTNWAGFAREIFHASAARGGPAARVIDITTAEYPTKATRPVNSSLSSSKFT